MSRLQRIPEVGEQLRAGLEAAERGSVRSAALAARGRLTSAAVVHHVSRVRPTSLSRRPIRQSISVHFASRIGVIDHPTSVGIGYVLRSWLSTARGQGDVVVGVAGARPRVRWR